MRAIDYVKNLGASMMAAGIRPGDYFASTAPGTRREVFTDLLVCLAVTALPVLLLSIGASILVKDRPFSWTVELFLYMLGWSTFVLAGSWVRRLTARFLGDRTDAPGAALFVTQRSVGAMLLVAILLRSTNALWPWPNVAADGGLFYGRVAFTVVFFLAGWLMEGRAVVAGFKRHYGQNTGRAILTWVSPVICYIVVIWLVLNIISMLP